MFFEKLIIFLSFYKDKLKKKEEKSKILQNDFIESFLDDIEPLKTFDKKEMSDKLLFLTDQELSNYNKRDFIRTEILKRIFRIKDLDLEFVEVSLILLKERAKRNSLFHLVSLIDDIIYLTCK